MLRWTHRVGWSLLLAMAGCLPEEPRTTLVPDHPFGAKGTPTAATQRTSFAPASTSVAARVDAVGRQLLAANPQIGVRPLFRTIGAPQPEVFHQGTTEIDITEGLAKQCMTDGQLAAVLCHELGKMVSEREAVTSLQTRNPERPGPVEVRVGNDNPGHFSPADQTNLAERWKLEGDRRRRPTAPQLPPDPQVLARTYLIKAGFAENELGAVAGLLQTAAANCSFEKQFNTGGAGRGWTPR